MPGKQPPRGASSTQMLHDKLWLFVQQRAVALGLDAVGTVDLDESTSDITRAGDRFEAWLGKDQAGDMTWLAETRDRRRDPTALWPEAKTAILFGHSYAPDYEPLDRVDDAGFAAGRSAISAYAKGRDYHDVLKGRLKVLAGEFVARAKSLNRDLGPSSSLSSSLSSSPSSSLSFNTSSGPDDNRIDVKVFVDTAPLMEKPLAQLAGLGWQGKHTNLVSRKHGSWLVLGAILTTARLLPTVSETDHCGSCRQCIDVCPTDAITAPYQLDASRCIAYLTIEHKGPIPHRFRGQIGNRVFGCDDCLAICPWNKFAAATREAKYQIPAKLDDPPIATLLTLNDAAFRHLFAGTPIKRTGRNRFLRNVAIAAGNSGRSSYVPQLIALLDDTNPLVRGASVWALERLLEPAEFQALKARRAAYETDATVQAEWTRSKDIDA